MDKLADQDPSLDPDAPTTAVPDAGMAVRQQAERCRVRLHELEAAEAQRVSRVRWRPWSAGGAKARPSALKSSALRHWKPSFREFREAARLAHAELASISETVFSQWADALNARINAIIGSFNPLVDSVQVTQNLELAVKLGDGRLLPAGETGRLSKGARDQVSLAARVAISEYLSAHVGCLPLVFDEPFAHWDDERFAGGMRFLAELANRHQVIVLTCHQWRYDRLLAENADLGAELEFCRLPDAGVDA